MKHFFWNLQWDSCAPCTLAYHANLQWEFLFVTVLRHAHACMRQHSLVTIWANWHTMSQQITSLKNSYAQSVCMSACAIPQICFWIFRRLQNGTINRPLWTQQLSCAFCRLAHSLFSSSQFSLFFPFFLPPSNWLPPYIFSLANHFLFCNHWP